MCDPAAAAQAVVNAVTGSNSGSAITDPKLKQAIETLTVISESHPTVMAVQLRAMAADTLAKLGQ